MYLQCIVYFSTTLEQFPNIALKIDFLAVHTKTEFCWLSWNYLNRGIVYYTHSIAPNHKVKQVIVYFISDWYKYSHAI